MTGTITAKDLLLDRSYALKKNLLLITLLNGLMSKMTVICAKQLPSWEFTCTPLQKTIFAGLDELYATPPLAWVANCSVIWQLYLCPGRGQGRLDWGLYLCSHKEALCPTEEDYLHLLVISPKLSLSLIYPSVPQGKVWGNCTHFVTGTLEGLGAYISLWEGILALVQY